MLRNSTVGTKLMAVILPPLLVVVGITAYGVNDRVNAAHRAEDASFAVSMLWAGRQLTSELQVERMWSALLLDGLAVSNELTEQQSITDRSWNLYLTLASQVKQDVVYKPMVDQAVEGLRDLQSVRSTIRDGSRDLYGAFDWYGNAINQVTSVATGAVGAVPDAQGSLDLVTYVSFALAQEAYAKRAVAHLAAQGQGSFDAAGRLWRLERAANNRAFQMEQLLYTSANNAQTEAYNELLNSTEVQTSIVIQDGIFDLIRASVNQGDGTVIEEAVLLSPDVVARVAPSGSASLISPTAFLEITASQLATLDEFGRLLLTQVDQSVHASHKTAKSTAMTFVVGALIGLVISALLAWMMTRRLTAPIRQLNKDAKELARNQIPTILEQMNSPDGLPDATELTLLANGRRDELGQLARSFDQLQLALLGVAEDQSALLHKGISDLFVNIARRNQSLIDRQIEFIDELETQEKDPELLDSLYKLDHLATQIRRNDESLLVLAGVETGLRRSRPVELHDVIRMAMGEIEQYQRVKLVSVEPVLVTGNTASNVAHILAELMDNATTYSPPESFIDVVGETETNGSYTLTITDHGIGMTQDQINQLNAMLKEPPLIGLSLNRNLGLAITARLAARLGAKVDLASTETGGVQALVNLPKAILPEADVLADQMLPPRSSFRPQFAGLDRSQRTATAVPPAELGSTTDPFSSKPTLPPVPTAEPEGLPESIPEPPSTPRKFTAAGLVRRVPLAERKARAEKVNSLIEPPDYTLPTPTPTAPAAIEVPSGTNEEEPTQLASYQPDIADDPTLVSTTVGETTTSAPYVESEGAKRSQRSPEEVRQMLSRYRSGLRQGQSAASTDVEADRTEEDK